MRCPPRPRHLNRRRFPIATNRLEPLEARQLLSAGVVSAAGANAAAITPARDSFRFFLGGGTVAGANGSFGGLRREINWDGVPAASAAPNALPADFFNVTSPRGVLFSTAGSSFQVSGAAADAATAGQPAASNFGNIDPTYSTAFSTFSPERLFTPIGSNITDVTFFLPGTTTPATTDGFGAVFTDVDTANATSIQFFDLNGASLGTFFVPASAGNAGLSFLGVYFDGGERVARVRITAGTAALGADDVTQNAANGDVVAMDDFLYGEPGAFTVLNTNDAGAGSLRQALINANAVPGKQTIDFAIPGAGVHTITLASTLPASTDAVAIDGYTQPGSSPNTLAIGDNAVLNVEVDAAGFSGFQLQGGNSLLRGLVLNDYHAAAIDVQSSDNTIAGNFLGVDPTGTLSRQVTTGGIAPVGVNLTNGNANIIGGATPAQRNVISANFDGVASFYPGTVSGTQILGNYIGTDRTGTQALGNTNSGLELSNPGKGTFTVGGTAPGAGNVISGNTGGILFLNSPGSNRVAGNLIGVASDGVSPLPNNVTGILLVATPNVLIGGLNSADANTIAYNTGRGISVGTGAGVAVLSNRIYANGQLGIDLGSDGVTPNDPSDPDTGPNNLQNFPAVLTAANSASATTIGGLLNSTPNTSFVLQFYSDPSADASGSAQGRTLLGQTAVVTDGFGNGSFTFVSPTIVPAGQVVTATATNLNANPFGDTSEFAPPVVVASQPVTGRNFLGAPFLVGQLIQAEDFDNGGEGVAYHDHEAANLGGAYRSTEGVDIQKTSDAGGGFNVGWTKSGEWMDYTVNVQGAGTYDLALRLAAASAGGTMHISLDGAPVATPLSVPNTGGWQNWTTLTVPALHIGNGLHTLRVAFDAEGSSTFVTNLNWLMLSPASTTIQAEDFNNGGEGVGYHDTDSINQGGQYRSTGVDIEKTTDTGGGFDVGWTKAGEWLKYNVGPVAAGTYTIDFRVASNGSGGTFHLEVDGTDVTGPMTVPNTTGWQKFVTISKTGVAISGGTHVLRLAMDSNGTTGFVGNFNFLRLTQTA